MDLAILMVISRMTRNLFVIKRNDRTELLLRDSEIDWSCVTGQSIPLWGAEADAGLVGVRAAGLLYFQTGERIMDCDT